MIPVRPACYVHCLVGQLAKLRADCQSALFGFSTTLGRLPLLLLLTCSLASAEQVDWIYTARYVLPMDGRADPIEPFRSVVAALAGKKECEPRGGNSQRDVEQEDGAPRHLVDQPAAKHGARGRGQGADTRPYPDRMAAFVLVESRA